MIFQRFNQNKHKRNGEKMLSHQPQTAQGGYVNGFISLRSLDGWFHCPGRKSIFGLNKDENRQTEFHLVPSVFL